jgi:hypothetical protein
LCQLPGLFRTVGGATVAAKDPCGVSDESQPAERFPPTMIPVIMIEPSQIGAIMIRGS